MQKHSDKGIFLISIDLEDIRLRLEHPEQFAERVPINTYQYLEWFNKHKAKCTFFVTGDMAEIYPFLIRDIISEGHEIACHTYNHVPLDQHTPESFRLDMEKNILVLKEAGANNITGFRAPVMSLTPASDWAYKILSDLGFRYSSSVLPAKNPLYGWANFGNAPKQIDEKITEFPVTVGKIGPLTLPVFSGIYFRTIPFSIIKQVAMKSKNAHIPVLGYIHPYDIDFHQERYMNPGINNNRIYNYLMYYNRNKVFSKLEKILDLGFEIITYSRYINNFIK